ncbi:DUF1648 domain-containing protein [Clostridium sediminicola]|uniref:DUF5808 domain-containing protein n=1 Tax=Clostridium sediminicola TaxID=3114879 RepID=UPI0031F2764E
MKTLFLINFIVYVGMFLLGMFIGRFSGNQIIYGVTIPSNHRYDDKIINVTRNYLKKYTMFGSILTIAAILLDFVYVHNLMIIIYIFLWMVLTIVLYRGANLEVKTFKENIIKTHKGDYKKSVIIASLEPRKKEYITGKWVFIIPLGLAVASIVVTALNYHLVPDQIPIRFNEKGIANNFVDKTLFNAFMLPLIQMGTIVLIYFVAIYSVRYSKRKIDPRKPRTSEIQLKVAANRMVILLGVIGTMVTVSMTYFQLVTLGFAGINEKVTFALTIIPLVIIFISFIIFVMTTGIHGDKVKVGFEEEENNEVIEVDDDDHWIYGFIYYNKNDPSIMVPKRLGLGHTFNFGNPISVIIMCAILLFIVFSIIFRE